jgi:ADP-ribose pyrophosphatase
MRTMADTIASRTVFEGRVFHVDEDRVRLPNGREVTLQVVRHAAAAILVPMPDPDHVVLIRQYRYPVARYLWELPAGTVDAGETPEQAAARECHEEIGLVPQHVERLASMYPTPGYCDEEMVFFRLTGLREPAWPAALDPDEDIEPRVFTLAEARDMVRRGEIVDMKSAMGLVLASGLA